MIEGFIVKVPIKWAMVGGEKGSQIGYIHRSAALRDDHFKLVAGAFDLDLTKALALAKTLHVAEDRCYPNYQTMYEQEQKRADGIQAVTIATPNGTHYQICKAILAANLHIFCEKPLCFSLAEATELLTLARVKQRIFAMAYGYSGHQMIEQARAMIAAGELGEIRMLKMEFAHGFHSKAIEDTNPSIKWRVTPEIVGPSYVLGDLATYTLFLSQMMAPQLKIKKLLCKRKSFVKSRAPLEDSAHVLMEYETGAIGSLWASCVNAGSMHGQIIRVIGSKASLEWWDERPNQLRYEIQGKPVQNIGTRDALFRSASSNGRSNWGWPC